MTNKKIKKQERSNSSIRSKVEEDAPVRDSPMPTFFCLPTRADCEKKWSWIDDYSQKA